MGGGSKCCITHKKIFFKANICFKKFVRGTGFPFTNKEVEVSQVCNVTPGISSLHLAPGRFPMGCAVDSLKQLLSRNSFAFPRACYQYSLPCGELFAGINQKT